MTKSANSFRIQRKESIFNEKLCKLSDYSEKYEQMRIIGKGSFGKVQLFRERNSKTLLYAIKTIKVDPLSKSAVRNLNDEINILRTLDHPNIVKYFETYEEEGFIHMVMEFIPGDDLYKYIKIKRSSTNKFPEHEASAIIFYVCKALKYIHSNQIVHRDLKPTNILISDVKKFYSIKIIDFGLSAFINTRENGRVGSPYFMAPEVINNIYCYESDIWSLGVIIYYMVIGNYPFKGKDKKEVFQNTLRNRWDKEALDDAKISNELKDLIKKIFVIDRKKRISLDNIMNHDWMSFYRMEDSVMERVDETIMESLRDFGKVDLVKKEILFYLSKLITEKEMKKLNKAFIKLDVDGIGTLDQDKIMTVCKAEGFELSEVAV